MRNGISGVLLLVLMLSGCSLAPEYVPPSLDLPQDWGAQVANEGLEVQWWKRFNDPVLDQFVDQSLRHNQNIEVAMARVDQARAALGMARADQFPSLAGGFSAMRARPSLEASGGYETARGLNELGNALNQMNQLPNTPFSYPREMESYTTALQAVWELDLWGKFRNSTAAAREQLLATEAAQRGVLLSLAGQTCMAYFSLRNYDQQLAIAERTLETRLKAMEIYQARFNEGLISELDLMRAKTEVDTMRANVYTAQYQVDAAESALLVLTGRSPREIYTASPERGLSLDVIPSVPQLPAGLPSGLLERRPDILAAEAQLRASNFQIGVARANWFPSISLTGQLGSQSGQLDNLFKGASSMWTYGADLSLPILTFGRISSGVKISEAAMREAVGNYNLTVQQAFQEVRDSLVMQNRTIAIADTISVAVENLRHAADLANLRYENGYASYLEVLDAERSLFDAEIQLANVRTSHLSSIVKVCMALGGGWTDEMTEMVRAASEARM